MAGEIRRLKFLEGVIVTTPITANVVAGFSGSIDLTTGEASKSVTFPSNTNDTNYKVFLNIECDDVNAVFPNYTYKNKTVSGFDIVLNAPVDSDNYKINYMVTL